jgi:hypothetical protein
MMRRPVSLSFPALGLVLAAFLGACAGASDTPATDTAATPASPAAAEATEFVVAGMHVRVPPGFRVRETGGGQDFRLYALSPTDDTTRALVEFYVGNTPDFTEVGSDTLSVNGLRGRHRRATAAEGLTSREVLLQLPRTTASGPATASRPAASAEPLPTRLHLFYNRLPATGAELADSVIASIRCCDAPAPR